MAKLERKQLRKRYVKLHLFWDGLVIVSLIITIAAGAISGATTTEILLRCILIFLGLSISGAIVVRSWATWESIHQSALADKLAKRPGKSAAAD